MRTRYSLWILLGVVLVFATGLAYESWYHLLRASLAYSIIPQDDFYYYYLTARNLALHGFSSFDGIVPTNGYHPLWLWCLTGLVRITRGSDRACFFALPVLQILASAVSAGLLRSLLCKLYRGEWILPISLLASLLPTVLIFSGMETAVAVPFYLLFLLSLLPLGSNRSFFFSGIAASLLVLSRLDAVFAVAFAFLLFFLQKKSIRQLLFFLLGLVPVAAYLIWNQCAFGNWEPVSAQAKQLGGWHFSYRAIDAIASPRGSLYFLLTIVGFILSARKKSIVRMILFGFPLLLIVLWAFRLSWSGYYWYYYPFPISAATGALELLERMPARFQTILRRLPRMATLGIIIAARFLLQRDMIGLTSKLNLVESQTRAQPNIYIHALGIKAFTDSHPGRYAMGDRAGLTAYLTHQPILQLEGLAADQAVIDSISARAHLLNVLRKYGVRYYIVSYPLREFKEKNDVWTLFEPHKQQVQPWAPTMDGSFFAPEVFRYPAPVGAELTHADSSSLWVTRILDISRAHE
ncbi:MAG TPA: hypothetical protein VGM92_06440 [Candidatus Kapabacteria bacterium]|jgi:hypothetical protein